MTFALPLLYLSLILVLGLRRRRPFSGEEDYYLAGRSGGVVLITGSLVATMLGAFGAMGLSGLAYRDGLVAGWYLWGGVAALLVLGAWGMGRLRMERAFTLPELLGDYYGPVAGRVLALLIVLSWISLIAAQLIAAGRVLEFAAAAAGRPEGDLLLNRNLWVVLTGIIFMFYTAAGGQHAVLRTDLLQAVALVGGLVALGVCVARFEPAAAAQAVDNGELWRLPFNAAMPPARVLLTVATFGAPFLVGPDIYSRLFSGRDVTRSRRAVVAAALILAPVTLLIVALGARARALAPGLTAAESETVILRLAVQTLHPLAFGGIVAALLAAVMSSADTCLLTISTLINRDLLGRRQDGDGSGAGAVRRGQLAIVGAGLVSLVIALFTPTVIGALQMCYRVYSPVILAPFLYMVLFPRGRPPRLVGAGAMGLSGAMAVTAIALDSDLLHGLAFVAPAVALGGHRLACAVRRRGLDRSKGA